MNLNNLKDTFILMLMPWVENKPTTLPFGEWDIFDKKQKESYPIRWFLFDTIPEKISFFISDLRDLQWKFIHRYIPKHQYHIIHTSLKPGYYDPDIQILYATMDLVKTFIDEQKDAINWDSSEEYKNIWKELQEIYHWWTEIYPNRKIPDAPNVSHTKMFGRTNSQYENDPEVIAFNNWCDLHNKIEQEWSDEENQMLIKVVTIRKYLWYV